MDRREFVTVAGLALGAVLLPGALRAQANEPGAFAFAVIADPHLSEDKPNQPTAADKLRSVLAQMQALPRPPDFLLVCGDIHVKRLVPLLPEITIPAHYVAGNHESAADRKQLRELFPADFAGRDFYAFTHKGCRFIGLCTAMVGDHVGHLESEDITPPVGQIEWLEQELKQSAHLPHRVIFGHIPPEPSNKPNAAYLGSLEAKWLHELVGRERVRACYFGHRHLRHEYQVGETQMVTVPSINWNFGTHPRGFYYVNIEGGTYRSEFINCQD